MVVTGWFVAEASPLAYGKLPLSFEANQGQTDPSVAFVARSTGYQLYLTRDEAVLVLRRPGAASADTLRMALVDATGAMPEGVERLPGAVSYLRGNDRATWRSAIPLYAKVRARAVYPGIDLVYYGNQRQLEYDFLVAPGADPAGIRLRFDGLVGAAGRRALVVEPDGDLTLRVPGGDVRMKRPVAYQEDAQGRRSPVDVAFALVPAPDGGHPSHVGFRLGAYDRTRPLVIDPVLSYASYLGETDVDAGMAIAVRDGEAYITGYTESLTFPPGGTPPRDAFVAKLNASGSGVVYLTYFGGSGADAGMGIAVDASGQAYVTGFTDSADFPTVAPLFGNQGGGDAFVAKLNAAGSAFVYATYLGGGLEDTGLGIAVDGAGNAYVTGWTDSVDFPTTVASALQADQAGRDAFVTKIAASGAALLYSTYLGGSGADEGQAIAVDAAGFAYVTGDTTSTDMPTSGNTRTHGGAQDAFVAKLNPSASGAASSVYLSYFGGSGEDGGRGVAVDSLGSIVVTGVTSSPNLPTKSAYQAAHGGGQDAFLARFNPAGGGQNQAFQYSSYLGGSGDDAANGIAVDAEDQVSIAGTTASANFPTVHGIGTGLGGSKDAFVAKFDPLVTGAASLRYSTYLGGSAEDEGYGIALDAAGSAYVVGLTRSGDFPSGVGGLGGPEDAFVAKLGEPDLEVSVFTVPATGGEGQAITVTDTTRNKGIVTAGSSTTAYYLSTDNRLDPADTLLGTRTVEELEPGEESTADTLLTLPTPLTPGTYFLFARADDADAIGESFESNNRARRTIVIGADLAVTVLSASTSGLTVTVTDTTRNTGGSTVGVSTTTRFFLSGPGGEVLLGSRTVGPLDAGAESAASTDFSMPPNTAGGNYTLIARADADGVLTETSETNNEKTTPFAVGVDLIVSALTVPGTSGAGLALSITPTIQNRGAIASTNSTTEFFLSTSSTLDGTAVSIGTQAVGPIAPGATSAVAVSVTIPASTTPGSYFVIAKANSVTPIAETNANNNTRARTSVVGPDLTISFLSPSTATSGPGKTITFKDTTKNIGGGNAAASVTKLYLSTNATYEATDIELGQRPVPALTPGQDHFNADGVSLTIPAGTAAGNYFIIARANAGTTPIGESSTTNNTASATLEIAGADLVVSVLTVSLSSASSVAITDTTTNQGTATAGSSVTRFYFSLDTIFDEATDPVLGERVVGQLTAGAESVLTTTLPLPAGTTPGSYTIFARADATGLVTESDESNNRRSRTLDTRGSDLTVSNLSFSFGNGATLNVTDTTRNAGPSSAGSSQTRFYVSTDATLGAGDVQIGGRTVVSLAATNQSTATTPVTIPATTVPGDYFLIARADDANVVGEVDEENNTTSVPISIKPDLIVESLNLPSTASPDTPITASGSVRNTGPIAAAASALKFYMSADNTHDPADTLLATKALNALGPDKSEGYSVQITLPAGAAGALFIIAKADADEQVGEASEANNTRAKSIPVGPDLIVSAFSGVPAATGAGSTFTVNDTTRNLASAAVGESMTRFFLSTNNVYDPGTDVALASRVVPGLGARRTSSANTPLTIPSGTAAGSYFILAVADADQVHAEASETNNTAAAPILIGGDLVVSALSAALKTGTSNTITVTDTTANQGGSPVGSFRTRFYLSTNATFEPGDIALGDRLIDALNAGASSSSSTDFGIPSGTAPSTYFVIARADADGVVTEVDETNNARTSGTVVIGTDLVVSAMNVPVTAGLGTSINISTTVTNLGGAQAGESVLKLFLSTDTVVSANDTELGTRLVPSLLPGAVSTGSTPVTIPVDASSGSFFVIAQADANGQVAEVAEANNTLSAPLRVGADLRVASLNAPAEAAAGGVINIKDSVKNEGAATLVDSIARYYLSTDDVLDPAVDTLLHSRMVPPLARGASSAGNFDVTLPAGLPAGTYVIIAQADATNTVAEAIEDNNLRSRTMVVGPDYVISGVTGPGESGSGLSVTIGATTKNDGAAGPQTVTEFYLSTDKTLTGTHFLLGSRPVPQLPAGNSNGGTITVTLPANLTPGPYFIVAKANAGGVSESNTTNNLKDRSITIGPDLVVQALTVPTPVGAGVSFTVSETTKNDKTGTAAPSTTTYYLSTNDVLDASDIVLGSRQVPELTAGAQHQVNTPLTIPVGTPDGAYFIIARANEPNTVLELNTANNERSRSIKVGPDLVISTFTAPSTVTAGTTVVVSDTTTNQGPGAAAPFAVRVYLSLDEILDPATDPEVGSRLVNGVAGGTASSGQIDVAVPAGLSGTYVLIAVADADGVLTELSETNNQKQKTIKIVP